MTSNKKAHELYWFFYQEVADCYEPFTLAKKMAIKVCDEVINTIEFMSESNEPDKLPYWEEVKQELEKL